MALKTTTKLMLAGSALVAIAGGVLVVGGVYPPSHSMTSGTIVPAERYRAKQMSHFDVGRGDKSVPTMMQTDSYQAAANHTAVASQAASSSAASAAATQAQS